MIDRNDYYMYLDAIVESAVKAKRHLDDNNLVDFQSAATDIQDDVRNLQGLINVDDEVMGALEREIRRGGYSA